MSRKVLITKRENTTIVATWDTINPNLKTIFDYNNGANVFIKDNVLVIEKPNLAHPTLFITYDQLNDALGATNILEYKNALNDNDYFITGQVGSSGGGIPQYRRQLTWDGNGITVPNNFSGIIINLTDINAVVVFTVSNTIATITSGAATPDVLLILGES